MSKIPEHLLLIRPFFLSTPGILISLLRRTSENLGVHWLPKFQETVLQACTIGCWWEDTVSVVCLPYILYPISKTASQTLKNGFISLVIRASDYHSLGSSFPIPVWFSKGLSAHWLIHSPLKCLLNCGHSAWIWPMRQVSDPPHSPHCRPSTVLPICGFACCFPCLVLIFNFHFWVSHCLWSPGKEPSYLCSLHVFLTFCLPACLCFLRCCMW